MSIKLVAWVLDHYENETCQEWKAMVALSEWSGPEGVCYPSLDKIGSRLGLKRSQTGEVIHRLADRGDIIIIPPIKKGRGYFNAYLVVGPTDAQTVGSVLRTHHEIKGRIDEEGIEKIEAYLVNLGVPKAPEPENRIDISFSQEEPEREPEEKEPSLWEEGGFTPERELRMLLGADAVIRHPKEANTDHIRELQIELEKLLEQQGRTLEPDYFRLAIFFRYATGWNYPIKKHWGRWTAAFDEQIELFSDPFLIFDLYAAAYASLTDAKKKSKIDVPPHPTSLTKTMEAHHASYTTRRERDPEREAILSQPAEYWEDRI